MSENCVCGGSTANPNMDCERCQLIAKLAAERKRADEAESRTARLEEGIRRFMEQYSECESHAFVSSISHLPATCRWSEKAKKQAEAWNGLEDLLSAGEEAKGANVS